MKTLKPITKLSAFVVFSLSLSSVTIFADTVVIVNPDSGVTTISADEAKSIFLGKSKKLPDGKKATPVELEEGSAARENFNDKVLHKSERKHKAYWAKKVFAGKGKPPKQLGDDKAVITFVNSTEGGIDRKNIDATVKAVLTVK